MELIARIRRQANSELARDARDLLETIDKSGLAVVLLSGSVARGDFYPGRYGGMVDLTVMRAPGATMDATQVFGPDEEPGIPWHCIKRKGTWFQIGFGDLLDARSFLSLDEARKYAIMESVVLWECDGLWSSMEAELQTLARYEQQKLWHEAWSHIQYLLSDYKEDRWIRREAWAQLHGNLNLALDRALSCLFYRAGLYAPADDRRIYHACALPGLPTNFEKILASIMQQDWLSEADYQRRRRLFFQSVLPLCREG